MIIIDRIGYYTPSASPELFGDAEYLDALCYKLGCALENLIVLWRMTLRGRNDISCRFASVCLIIK